MLQPTNNNELARLQLEAKTTEAVIVAARHN